MWADRNRRERLSCNLGSPVRTLQPFFLPARCVAYGTSFELRERAGECNAGVAAHVVFDRDNSSVRSDQLFYTMKGKDVIRAWGAREGGACCLANTVVRKLRGVLEG